MKKYAYFKLQTGILATVGICSALINPTVKIYDDIFMAVIGTFCLTFVCSGLADLVRLRGERRSSKSKEFFPNLWELITFLFPKKIQKGIWIPYGRELHADYTRAHIKERVPTERLLLYFGFTTRTIFGVLVCYILTFDSKVMRKVIKTIFRILR